MCRAILSAALAAVAGAHRRVGGHSVARQAPADPLAQLRTDLQHKAVDDSAHIDAIDVQVRVLQKQRAAFAGDMAKVRAEERSLAVQTASPTALGAAPAPSHEAAQSAQFAANEATAEQTASPTALGAAPSHEAAQSAQFAANEATAEQAAAAALAHARALGAHVAQVQHAQRDEEVAAADAASRRARFELQSLAVKAIRGARQVLSEWDSPEDKEGDAAFKEFIAGEDGEGEQEDPAYTESANALASATGWSRSEIEGKANRGIRGLTAAIGGGGGGSKMGGIFAALR